MSYTSSGIGQNMEELIQAGGEPLSSEISKLITTIFNEEAFSQLWKDIIIVHLYKKGNETE
jgi:hypothetical protein